MVSLTFIFQRHLYFFQPLDGIRTQVYEQFWIYGQFSPFNQLTTILLTPLDQVQSLASVENYQQINDVSSCW